MNTVWCENLAGITGLTTTNLYEDYTKFGSYQYLGDKSPYLDYPCGSDLTSTASTCNTVGLSYDDEVSKSISILHYTNNAISSLYGEFIDATNNKIVKLIFPDLMYHILNLLQQVVLPWVCHYSYWFNKICYKHKYRVCRLNRRLNICFRNTFSYW
jgi:hypothetical protein